MDNITDQIKERINVVDLIGEYLKLERAGSNYKALCPFHNEKTPSFMVNPERNFWYCFGCQKGGDIFSLDMYYGLATGLSGSHMFSLSARFRRLLRRSFCVCVHSRCPFNAPWERHAKIFGIS